MAKLSGGQAAVESLKAEKASHVFGLIGSATMELFDALYDAGDITFIGVRDERSGTHMADGFARASGRAGVVLAGQNGPGATNLVTGLAQAAAAFSPVVSIAGALSSGHVDRGAFQEVDQQALFGPVTKKTWTVTAAERVPEMFREAFRTALTPRRGPVQLNLPRDVLAATAELPAFQEPRAYRCQSVPAAAPAASWPSSMARPGSGSSGSPRSARRCAPRSPAAGRRSSTSPSIPPRSTASAATASNTEGGEGRDGSERL